MESGPQFASGLKNKITAGFEDAWHANPGAVMVVALGAASILLSLLILTLHPGSAQHHSAMRFESGVTRLYSATPGQSGTGTGANSSSVNVRDVRSVRSGLTTGAALPLTPLNPALISFQPSPELLMRGPQDPSRVALTFDAGSDAKAVPLILKALEERHVHATFFLTGRFCEKFPSECRAIADAGMELGNHSYRHPHFTKLSDARILQELDRGEEAIVKACGRGAKPLFRFPYGDCDARTQRIVAAAGYQPIRWTLDSLDAFREPKTADFVTERINSRIKPGFITLMHVSCVTSAESLPRIFEQLDKMGAQQALVSDLLLSAQPGGTKIGSRDAKERITQ